MCFVLHLCVFHVFLCSVLHVCVAKTSRKGTEMTVVRLIWLFSALTFTLLLLFNMSKFVSYGETKIVQMSVTRDYI